MKTAKEFIEKLQSNEDLAAQIREKAAAAEDKFAAVSAAAKELGYEISPRAGCWDPRPAAGGPPARRRCRSSR